LTFKPDIVIPNGFTDAIDCLTFESMEELDEKIDYCLANQSKVAEIVEAGHQRLLAHHTTARRAEYFLEHAMKAVARDGYCERFYSP
jgi:spore maturation protein CgeB